MASKITKIVANFSTQLASTINVASTTGSLKSPVLDSDGVQVADGKYVMAVNLGESNEEHLIFDLVGSTGAMSNIYSISRQGVETAGALKQHRTGAKVVLTDYANLLYIAKVLTGQVELDGSNPLVYDVAPTFSNVLQLATKGYVDSAIVGGVGTSSRDVFGTVKTTRSQGSKPRVKSILVREQATPDKTLAVESFKQTFIDAIINYAGGNTPNFIDPALGGDFAFALNPANGETITITVDGVATTVTFVTTIGAVAGNILIGGTVAVTRANFVNFINNPSVTNANQVAVTGTNLTAIQKLSATDDTTLNAFIRAVNPATTSLTVTETLAGAGNQWTTNTVKNRYDLVVVDSSSNLQIRKGVESASPVIPTPTSGDVVLASVFNKCGQTAIRETFTDAGSTNGYITEWYNPSIYRTDIPTNASLPATTLTLVAGENIAINDAVGLGYGSTVQVAYDSSAGSNVVNNTSLTFNITVANNLNRVLLVAVAYPNGADISTSVTANGVAMTKVGFQAGVNQNGVTGGITVWKLANPPTGVVSIVSTLSSAITHSVVAYSYYNADQSSIVDNFVGGNGSSGSAQITNTIPTAGDIVQTFGMLMNGMGGVTTPSSLLYTNTTNLQTASGSNLLRANNNNYDVFGFMCTIPLTTVGQAVKSSLNSGDYTGGIQVLIKPAVTPTLGLVKTNASNSINGPLINFIGFAKQAVSAGANLTVSILGIISGLTGLTAGSTYYLSNTAGQISTTAGTNSKKIGVAVSTTSLIIKNENN